MSPSTRHVLHVLNGAVGGAAKSTVDLAHALDDYGIRSTIYCMSRTGEDRLEQLRKEFGGAVVAGPLHLWHRRTRKPMWQRPALAAAQFGHSGLVVRSSLAVARAARAAGVDMIHSSTGLSPDGAVAAGHLGLPHVWHLRELVGPTGNVRLRGDRNGQVGRRVARTGVAIANSNTTAKAWFADAVGSVTVVPNGIVVEGLTSIRQTERGSDRLVFGMVANLSSTWKRHEDFVRAAAEVARVLPNSRFVVFGEIPDARDPYVEALRTLVTEYKLGETFEFRGYVQSAVDAMGALDVLVHPSDWESFGRVFIEAGAAGKPVIGVRAGAATEVVVHGETGLLCEPRDPSSLAGSMIELGRSDELRQRLGVGGRARVERLYTIDACASGVMDAYVRATARPTRSLRLADAVLRTMR